MKKDTIDPKEKKTEKTKLALLLEKKGWYQADLQTELFNKFKYWIGRDRISEIVRGLRNNHNTDTIVMIAAVLEVTPNEIIEYGNERAKEIAAKVKAKKKK